MGFRELQRAVGNQTDTLTQLAREHAQTRGAVVQIAAILQRGLLGRLRWLVLGK